MKSLFNVTSWELKRARLDRSLWMMLPAVFVFCLAMTWFKHVWARPVVDGRVGETINILGTTQIGLPYLVIELLLTLVALVFPFVATDGLARDYRQRLHELTMATAIPTWAYVWGRYLASLLINLLLTVCLLAAVLLAGGLLRSFAGYPMLSTVLLLAIWGVAIIPAATVLTSVSFVLGAFWPRLANGLKLAGLVGWLVLVFMVDAWDRGTTWFTYWNPTSYGIVRVNLDSLVAQYQTAVLGVPDPSQHAALALKLQQAPVSLTPWIAPHAVLVLLSLTLVAATALLFSRFRPVVAQS